MPIKQIHLLVCRGSREEQLVVSLPAKCTAKEVQAFLRREAQCHSSDVIRLYDHRGRVLPYVSASSIRTNTPDSRYRLRVLRPCVSGLNGMERLKSELAEVQVRLNRLEAKLDGDSAALLYEVNDKIGKILCQTEEIEGSSVREIMSAMADGPSLEHLWQKSDSVKKTAEESSAVYRQFVELEDSPRLLEPKMSRELRDIKFNNWRWREAEMMLLLRQMFVELHLVDKFNIKISVLNQWLFQIYKRYNHVPFHNFQHCFMVSQMMYSLIWLLDLPKLLGDLDVLILLTSAICHDLEHPGYNNAYQINARTELALRYNDMSPLENHHCAVGFGILEHAHSNIFGDVSRDVFKRIREGMIKCILATDMAKHNEILSKFKDVLPTFNVNNKEHRDLLMMILIKVSDISNEVRPLDVAGPWVECLLEEFFNQSDAEKEAGLPTAPFMDREKVSKPSSQVGFITFVLLPLYEALGQMFPVMQEDVIQPVRFALDFYSKRKEALELRRRSSLEAIANATSGSGGE